VVRINVPDADDTKRGVINTGSQDIAGTKDFKNSVIVNGGVTNSDFLQVFTSNWSAILTDAASDQVNFFAGNGDYTGWVNIAAKAGSLPALTVTHESAGDAIDATAGTGAAVGVNAVTLTGNTGNAVRGFSGATGSRAGSFGRSVSGGTVSIVDIFRSQASDTSSLLTLRDTAATTSAVVAASYSLNGTLKWALETNGQIVGTAGVSQPTFSSFLDMDTGFGFTSGEPAMVDEGLPMFHVNGTTFTNTSEGEMDVLVNGTKKGLSVTNLGSGNSIEVNSTEFIVSATGGEVKFAGISGDGTGKVACVKANGFVGTCTTVVGVGGDCTCA
jgi:hypothetical protein